MHGATLSQLLVDFFKVFLIFAGSMLTNVLEFRDDAGNEIAFFEKKKKKCSQSVAMVSNLHFHTIKDFETVN